MIGPGFAAALAPALFRIGLIVLAIGAAIGLGIGLGLGWLL